MIDHSSDALVTLTTIRDYIRWGATRFNKANIFFGHGAASALDEAAALLLHTLKLPFDLSPVYLDSVLTLEERQAVCDLFDRRINERKPVAYLTNQVQFAGLPFYVDERVLVPRSPIAELINEHFSPWLEADQVRHVLDLCTGSACIAIACAYAYPEAKVDAIDLSDDALAVAAINVKKHDAADQVTLYHSDLFDALPPEKYDLIVSNPPYVSTAEWQGLPAEFHAEPDMGFLGGESGLDLVLRILACAHDFLTAEGILVVEVGSSAETLQTLYPDVPFYWLDFEHGGDGVFLLTAEQIKQFTPLFQQALK